MVDGIMPVNYPPSADVKFFGNGIDIVQLRGDHADDGPPGGLVIYTCPAVSFDRLMAWYMK